MYALMFLHKRKGGEDHESLIYETANNGMYGGV